MPMCVHNSKNSSHVKTVNLPFKTGTKFTVTQAAFGKISHNEPGNEYNWDLGVPYGTEVVAIEPGIVIEVWEPNKGGGCDPKFSNVAHNIKIEHSDGSVAQYIHIASKVKVGDNISAREVIATTSMNGWICRPHLHFGIYKSKNHLYMSPHRQTIPLRFKGCSNGNLIEKKEYKVE